MSCAKKGHRHAQMSSTVGSQVHWRKKYGPAPFRLMTDFRVGHRLIHHTHILAALTNL